MPAATSTNFSTVPPAQNFGRQHRGPSGPTSSCCFTWLFGYLLVRNLLPLVKTLSRLPPGVSRGFAAALNAATKPFHHVNFVGSVGGARVVGHERMERLMDRVVASLQRSLSRASEESLDRGMHFPVGWDPYFTDYMTVEEVYHYATQHYDHHRRQLTLASAAAAPT